MFLEYDESNNVGLWRLYMRIRVLVDFRVALKKRKKIWMENGEWTFISFKYERLGTDLLPVWAVGSLGILPQ